MMNFTASIVQYRTMQYLLYRFQNAELARKI